MNNLEKKLRTEKVMAEFETINKKQWIPVLGIFYAIEDHFNGKPSIMNDECDLTISTVGAAWHCVASYVPLCAGMYLTAEALYRFAQTLN